MSIVEPPRARSIASSKSARLLAAGGPLERILPPFTSNVADLLRLSGKGRIEVGGDADNSIDVHDVAPETACEGRRRQVVDDRIAPGGEALLFEASHRSHQIARCAREVVGAEQPDDRGDAVSGVATDPQRRYAAAGTGLAAAAGDVDVAVDQAGDQPAAADVDLVDDELLRYVGSRLTDPQDLAARHRHGPTAKRRWSVQIGVEKELNHRQAQDGGRRSF
jgi:hypothetical protein